MKEHPFYRTVAPACRFKGGGLEQLWDILNREARRELATKEDVAQDTGWHWRVLPRGALVALRSRQDLFGRRELRIARPEPATTPDAESAWARELAVFLKAFGIEPVDGHTPCEVERRDWMRQEPRRKDHGKAAARFLELRHGEINVYTARCHDCWATDRTFTEIPWLPAAGVEGQRCIPHAIEAGNRQLARARDNLKKERR